MAAGGIGNSYNNLFNTLNQDALQEANSTTEAAQLETQESTLNTKISAEESALKQSESTLQNAVQASQSIAKAWSSGIAQA